MTASAAGTVEEPGHNVAQKSGLNRAILDQAWGKFFQRLEWKCEQRGAQVIKVSPQYTSRICPVSVMSQKRTERARRILSVWLVAIGKMPT